MIIIDCEQGTPEWKKAREGVFTASQFGKFLIEEPRCRLTKAEICEELTRIGISHNPKATNAELEAYLPNPELFHAYTEKTKQARHSLICATLGELSGEEIPDFDTFATRRGKELEPGACDYYEEITGNTVETVGFVLHDSRGFGCSPDRFVNNREGGLEVKCPFPKTHVEYLLAGVVPDEYLMQVHGSMAVTGLKWWDFMSYAPGLPPLVVRTEWSDTTDRLLSGLLDLRKEYEVHRATMKSLWNQTFAKAS